MQVFVSEVIGSDFRPGQPTTDDEWAGEEGGSIISQTTSIFTARETRPVDDGIVVGTALDEWDEEGFEAPPVGKENGRVCLILI